MRHTLTKHYMKIVIAILIIAIFWQYFYSVYQHNKNIESIAKIKLLRHVLSTKSDIQILKEQWATASSQAAMLLRDIDKYKRLIEETQRDYEYNILWARCSKDQISRMIDWLEYNVNYCKGSKNLESFRIKKS